MAGFVAVHRQVSTSRGVFVDEGMRALLEALWAAGLDTEFSCQGVAGGLAHVCFADVADARRFAAGRSDLVITKGERRAWVDFPPEAIDGLTEQWSAPNRLIA